MLIFPINLNRIMALITTDYGLVTPPPGCTLDFGHPINNGLSARWLFNEKGGSRLTDYSGNNNHGTLTNFAMTGATSNWVGSPMGGALHFDGSNDVVKYAAADINYGTKHSLSIWINSSDVSTGKVVVGKANSAGGGYLLGLISGNMYYNAQGSFCNSSYTLSNNKWYHIVITRNSTTSINFYVNGVFASTNTMGGANNAMTSSYIGGYGNPANCHSGSIGNGGIWNRALSPAEVSQLYSQPNIGIQSPTYYTP